MATKKRTNPVVWVMMVLLFLGLAGFGATSFSGGQQTVASVDDVEIDVNSYLRAVDNQTRQFSQLTGQPLSFAQAQAIGLDRAALSTLVARAALESELADVGISVGDETVAREIAQTPRFQDGSGSFSREVYEFSLRELGTNTRDYENDVRTSIATGILQASVAGGVAMPQVYVDTLFNYARETRDITWARLTADDLPEPIAEPSDGDLRNYHESNADLFTRPETRLIDYAILTPDLIAGEIEVSEDEMRALYDARLDEFVQPERRLVERLVFPTEEEAATALARVEAGDVTFDDLVAERGLTIDDVDLGDVAPSDLGDAADTIFAATDPGVLGPLPSTFGPALYRMNAILSAQETTFEEAAPDLRREAASDRARRIILERTASIEDLLAGGADIPTLVERSDMQAGQIAFNEEVFEDVAADAGFRAAANSAEPGGFAELVQLDDGGIAVIQVTEVQAPALKPFDEVRDDVISAWETAETQAALEALAEDLIAQLEGGREMAALDVSLNTDRALERTGFLPGTPPDFTDTVFEMTPNDLAMLSADGDAWIVRLDQINAADLNAPEAQAIRAQFAAETARELSTAVMAAFTQSVLSDSEVSVNQVALDALHATFR